MDVVIDVLPVDDERGGGARGPAQRGVEHRAVLGRVDVLAREHGGVVLGDPGLLGEGDERGEDLIGDEVLRQVYVQVAEREAQALHPTRIGGEPRPQVGGEGVAVGEELGPGGRGRGVDRSGHDHNARPTRFGRAQRTRARVRCARLGGWIRRTRTPTAPGSPRTRPKSPMRSTRSLRPCRT